MARAILLDTNLLLLLVIGRTAEDLIGRHKRTQAYDVASFRLLEEVLAMNASALVTTPHILAETSNLVRQCRDPDRSRVGVTLASLIGLAEEIRVEGRSAVQNGHYRRLGLTDAALLSVVMTDMTILTDDLDVYLTALGSGYDAVNFTHLREAELF